MNDHSAAIQSGTAAGLIAFLDYAVERGYAPQAMANAQKSASRQVLTIVESGDYENLDLMNADIDDILRRFDVKARGKLRAESVTTYRSRFSRAVESYRTFVQTGTPPTYRNMGNTARVEKKRAVPTTKKAALAASPEANVPAAVSRADYMVDYPFPLKSGTMATLRLPARFEKNDAERLAAFVRTLVFEAQRQLPPGDSTGD